jgi:hypothetical protein
MKCKKHPAYSVILSEMEHVGALTAYAPRGNCRACRVIYRRALLREASRLEARLEANHQALVKLDYRDCEDERARASVFANSEVRHYA